MINEPELKAMSGVLDALQGLDSNTQRRVVDWVMSKLASSSSSGQLILGAKRGPKLGSKRHGKKRGPKPRTESVISSALSVGAKRGPKPGKKRGPKPGYKRKGKRGRPSGSKNKASESVSTNAPKRRGRPSKLKI